MTNFEKIKSMSIDEMARSCMSFFLPVHMELHISVVLWKSDSMAVALTARNIGLKVR